MIIIPKLKLFFSYFSPPARSSLFVAKTLDLNVNLVHCDILTKKYLTKELTKINPQHCIPTLVDGDFVIWDSHAIAFYLINRYAPNDSLYPNNIRKRALIQQRLHFDSGVLYPRMFELIYPLIILGRTEVPERTVRKVNEAYDFLNMFLQKSPWLAGENVTVADLCCIPTITTMDYVIAVNQNKYPNLKKYIYHSAELPHYGNVNQVGLDKLGFRLLEMMIREREKEEKQGSFQKFLKSRSDLTLIPGR